ncbi:hypothetical protein AZI86_10530 [Bdellovibrio bacteriovorus]|uniref:Lipocalin/cytosolic fatty-acid binding domain-containing protein n=1 Tax=Bdellovibrio bacteriovorus TaxID=959 RepID=A0A150WLR5_BDEBC|nr:lipocalin family protein [Bdellovibrio bacteriovorus]KYG64643.1 hypothetical protein AZI86_10530 [Bdellovibrio bacteriovorus]
MKLMALLVMSSLILGCATSSLQEHKELKPSTSIEIHRYMGDWYVIANIPTMIEREAVNAIESYRWDDAEKRIYIDYSHHHSSPEGQVTSFLQEAWISDGRSNSEWKVRPIWPLQFDYMILDVAQDYSYSLVGVPDRSYVWIMSRQPKMPEEIYTRLVSRAEALGFDVSKLRKVPQVW